MQRTHAVSQTELQLQVHYTLNSLTMWLLSCSPNQRTPQNGRVGVSKELVDNCTLVSAREGVTAKIRL